MKKNILINPFSNYTFSLELDADDPGPGVSAEYEWRLAGSKRKLDDYDTIGVNERHLSLSRLDAHKYSYRYLYCHIKTDKREYNDTGITLYGSTIEIIANNAFNHMGFFDDSGNVKKIAYKAESFSYDQ